MNLHLIKGLVMWYMHLPFRIKKYQRNNERNLARIRQKDKITVVFFASNVAMWRYQGLYEEMQKYPRFETHIVLSPLKSKSKEEKIKAIESLRVFFDSKGILYFDYDTINMRGYDVKGLLKPDLVFVSQQYYTVMPCEHRYYKFTDSLLCFCPYSFTFAGGKTDYIEDFQNRAWRLYLPSIVHKQLAKKYASVGDSNVVVTGFSSSDIFMNTCVKDVWKSQSVRKKRIIWAPHFTIYNDGWLSHTGFLWMADFMLELAKKYKDSIQIAFKPHPKLRSELYSHKDWGKEKTDAYYQKWKTLDNGQLESGEFVDLFKSSDAMIHDSSSFVIEYHYTEKPVMFIKENVESFKSLLSELGKKAIDAHYIGKCKADIEDFIIEVVLEGNDTMRSIRDNFAKEFLYPQDGKTVAQVTMNDLLVSLSI